MLRMMFDAQTIGVKHVTSTIVYVCVASNTQKIHLSDWSKLRCAF